MAHLLDGQAAAVVEGPPVVLARWFRNVAGDATKVLLEPPVFRDDDVWACGPDHGEFFVRFVWTAWVRSW